MSPESPESPQMLDNLLITKGLNSYNPLIQLAVCVRNLFYCEKNASGYRTRLRKPDNKNSWRQRQEVYSRD